MKPGGQRKKGHDFERLVAKKLRDLGMSVRRGVQGGHDHSDSSKAKEPDVVIEAGPEDATQLWIECQCSNNPNPRAKLAQAMRDCPDDRTPCVIWKRSGSNQLYVTIIADINGAEMPCTLWWIDVVEAAGWGR